MDTEPLVLIADKSLSNQAALANLLVSDAQVTSIIHETQLDFWLQQEAEVLPSLLILDYSFFKQKTAIFCQRWLAHPLMRHVPIVITANADDDIELFALTCGAVDFLAKPFKLTLTLARIKLHLLQVKEHRRLSSLSMTDGLTQIANRRYFNEFYSAEWRRACRDQGSLGLIMIDIDHFKAFNDHYGHLPGDECLTSVAQQLKSAVQRPRDFVARFGGEEFIVLLPSIQPEGVRVVAERLQQALAKLKIPHGYSSAGQHVTVSMGLAWCEPDNDFRPDQLVAAADEALYSAKENGRNCFSEVVVVENQPIFQLS
jgi:two-component system chemotaxis family response regulator WspR